MNVVTERATVTLPAQVPKSHLSFIQVTHLSNYVVRHLPESQINRVTKHISKRLSILSALR
jgi:hypothetical protein